MNSTLNPEPDNPDAVLAARADERLTHAYEQIAHADEQLARVTEKLSRSWNTMPRTVLRRPPAAASPWQADATWPSSAWLLAAGIGAAGFRLAVVLWRSSQADACAVGAAAHFDFTAVAGKTREFRTAWLSTVQLAAAEASTCASNALRRRPRRKTSRRRPPRCPPELTQLLQNMARDIATVEQGIEQLKASQERMVADNAKNH